MYAIERAIASIRLEGPRRGRPAGVFDEVYAAYGDLSESERHVRAARDVMMLHLGSQSNLHAALAWTLVNVVQRPALIARIRDGDEALLEQAASDSIRLAQRSITLRLVLRPLDLVLEDRTYRLAPGVLLTTMLSTTNTSAAPGLDRFDPAHYDGRRLSRGRRPGEGLVSTFDTARTRVPQRFAVAATGSPLAG